MFPERILCLIFFLELLKKKERKKNKERGETYFYDSGTILSHNLGPPFCGYFSYLLNITLIAVVVLWLSDTCNFFYV